VVRGERTEDGGDLIGSAGEVEEMLHAREDRGQGARERYVAAEPCRDDGEARVRR
jgi:hypothetical protein